MKTAEEILEMVKIKVSHIERILEGCAAQNLRNLYEENASIHAHLKQIERFITEEADDEQEG